MQETSAIGCMTSCGSRRSTASDWPVKIFTVAARGRLLQRIGLAG
jgi:hypothetical protein